MKRALITGIGGQDGSFLAEILLEKGYEVHGLYRRSSVDNLARVQHIISDLHLHQGDVLDYESLFKCIDASEPDLLFHEADQDNVDWSYKTPRLSIDVTYGSVCNLLELVRALKPKTTKVFIPCSAMMFGDALPRQREGTKFNPLSPYACAKVAAFNAAHYYRQVHGLFVTTAILYNHDSVRRGEEYLLHKICSTAMKISRGEADELVLGSATGVVDIGCAHEYMQAVVKMMEQDRPLNLVLASNAEVPIRQIVEYVFSMFGINYSRFRVDNKNLRPGPHQTLVGDTAQAYKDIGFMPKVTWKEICQQICNK